MSLDAPKYPAGGYAEGGLKPEVNVQGTGTPGSSFGYWAKDLPKTASEGDPAELRVAGVPIPMFAGPDIECGEAKAEICKGDLCVEAGSIVPCEVYSTSLFPGPVEELPESPDVYTLRVNFDGGLPAPCELLDLPELHDPPFITSVPSP